MASDISKFENTTLPPKGDPCWPLGGYAPGDYMGQCGACGKRVMGIDKRAYECLPCAISSTKQLVTNLRSQLQSHQEYKTRIETTISTIKELFK